MSPGGTGGSQSTTCTGPGMKEIESGGDGDGCRVGKNNIHWH